MRQQAGLVLVSDRDKSPKNQSLRLIYIYKATWKNYDFVWRLNGGYTFETGPSFSDITYLVGVMRPYARW